VQRSYPAPAGPDSHTCARARRLAKPLDLLGGDTHMAKLAPWSPPWYFWMGWQGFEHRSMKVLHLRRDCAMSGRTGC